MQNTLIAVINIALPTTTQLKMTSKVAQIHAQQEELAKQLEVAMTEERTAVIAQMRKDIVDYKITATELKGVIKGRVTEKQIEEFIAKKAKTEAKKASSAKPKAA